MKSPRIVPFLSLFVLSLATAGGTYALPDFDKTYGDPHDDGARYVEATSDGGFVLCGYRSTPPDSLWDIWVLRTDAHGDTLWTSTFGSARNDQAMCVRETEDGFFVVTGTWDSYTQDPDLPGDIFLSLLDAGGSLQWMWLYTSHTGALPDTAGGAAWVLEDDAGDFVLTGCWRPVGSIKSTCWIKVRRSDQAVVWDHVYHTGVSAAWGSTILETPEDDGFLITGLHYLVDSCEIHLIKTDSLGDTLWTRSYGGPGNYEARHMSRTADGGHVITGNCKRFPGDHTTAYLFRIDANADSVWKREYPGIHHSAGDQAWQTADGGFVMAGYRITAETHSRDGCVIRTDGEGEVLWMSTFGDSTGDRFYSVAPLPYQFVLAGHSGRGGPAGEQVRFVRIDDQVYTSVSNGEAGRSEGPFSLRAASPALGEATVRLSLPRAAPVALRIYDPRGRLVRTLLGGDRIGKGELSLRWDGRDERGLPAPAGLYLLRMETDQGVRSGKVLLLR